MKEQMGHVKLIYIAAGFTSVLQLLDRSAMRPAKAFLRRLVATEFAEEMLEADDEEAYVFDFGISAQKIRFPRRLQSVLAFLKDKPKFNESGWRSVREKFLTRMCGWLSRPLSEAVCFASQEEMWLRSSQRQVQRSSVRRRPAMKERAFSKRRQKRQKKQKKRPLSPQQQRRSCGLS